MDTRWAAAEAAVAAAAERDMPHFCVLYLPIRAPSASGPSGRADPGELTIAAGGVIRAPGVSDEQR
jgi:hypothetical protein